MSSAFRVGIVSAQNPATAQVRVTFPDRNQMQSWWLGIVVPHTQNDKAYWIPDLGEQVVCLMDEHDEDGAVLGRSIRRSTRRRSIRRTSHSTDD